MAEDWITDTRTSYDTVAGSYVELIRDYVRQRPFLRSAIEVFAELVPEGPVADVGCGPGQITAHLNELGVSAFGVDLSPGMIEVARREHPELRFEVGSMTDPDLLDGPLAGVLVWWSLIHVPDEQVPLALSNFYRALRPGGVLTVGFHVGDETRLKIEGYGGLPMKVNVHRRRPEQVADWLRAAGFRIDAQWAFDRDEPSSQAILFAHRPDQSAPNT